MFCGLLIIHLAEIRLLARIFIGEYIGSILKPTTPTTPFLILLLLKYFIPVNCIIPWVWMAPFQRAAHESFIYSLSIFQGTLLKLDWVAPLITDPPLTGSTTLSPKKGEKKIYMTHDT